MGKKEDHNAGQDAGSKASWFERAVYETSPVSNPDFDKGFENGGANQPSKGGDNK
jgi:hypothetical protein